MPMGGQGMPGLVDRVHGGSTLLARGHTGDTMVVEKLHGRWGTPSAGRRLKEHVSKPTRKKGVLPKLNRDHVEKVPRKNQAKIEQKIEQKSREKGFVKQSQPITIERLCEEKPIQQNGKALRSKANRSSYDRKALRMERLCEAKPICKALRSKANPSHDEMALRSKANPS